MLDHAEMLEACARGDGKALQALFEAEAPRLIGVAQRILRRRDLAEEAVQEGFAQIWRNAARYDRSLGSARGWIYTIVRYRALNMIRDGKRETAYAPEDLDRMREESARESWDNLDPEGMLKHCLETLEPARRQALLLIYVLGLTQGEVAGRMHIPLGTAKSWVKRSLDRLRECMS